MRNLPSEFKTAPVVYAVGRDYQIFVPVNTETVMWVEVGDRAFYDDSNGILRSSVSVHRMTVPMGLLDSEKKYTVCYHRVIERKPYYSNLSDVMREEYSFRPIEGEKIRIYHIADAHNRVAEPVCCARLSGDGLDLLVLNGDIPNHSGDVIYFDAIHEIAAEITDGEIPVIFSRGNHDMRGIAAEKLEYYTPTDSGKSYFTFRLGKIWGIVLDAAEDKPDSHIAYGFTNCCEDFRRRETEFLKSVIDNAESEYLADGVEYRLVISHNPFTHTPNPPFDIEIDTFTEWARLLRENVKPGLMLAGHVHDCYVTRRGDPTDNKGVPCPVVVGSRVAENEYIGTRLELHRDRCEIAFTNSDGGVYSTDTVYFERERYDS